MDVERSKILQGSLDLMVLKTLDAMGPMHGHGIALRIEQVAGNALTVYQGTLYLCLVRLLQRKWLSATWATSENNRRAWFYMLTAAGRRQLQAETANWDRVAGLMERLLQLRKA
jgi:PadR family transcriptional regulator